jgi:hypothetical protein
MVFFMKNLFVKDSISLGISIYDMFGEFIIADVQMNWLLLSLPGISLKLVRDFIILCVFVFIVVVGYRTI